MSVLYSLLSFLFFIAVVTPSHAEAPLHDPELDSAVARANLLFLDAKFDEGIALVQRLEKTRPGDPAVSFFIANGYWWKIFRLYIYDKEARNAEYDKYFEYYLEQTIDRSEDLLDRNKRDVRALFYLGNAYSLRSRVKGLRGSYFSAGREAAKGKGYLEKVLELQPKQYDANYNLGIYNYFAGTLPGYAKVLKIFLFLPGGNKEKGLKLLKSAAENSPYFGAEAQLILARFYADFEEQPQEGLRIVQSFHQKHPDNAWFHYWKGTLYSDELNDYKRAKEIYLEILQKSSQGHPNYTAEVKSQAWLKLARCYNRVLYPEKAIDELNALVATKPKAPSWLAPRAYLELGNIYDQIGSRSQAIAAYRQVLNYPDYRDFHAESRRLMAQNYNQSAAEIYRLNLEGRRLAHAGKFDQAQQAFEKVMQKYPDNNQTKYSTAEMLYLRGSHIEAAAILNKLAKSEPREPKWLLPAVYVKLGQIYQAGKQADAARISYQKALETKFIGSDDRNTAKRALKQIVQAKSS